MKPCGISKLGNVYAPPALNSENNMDENNQPILKNHDDIGMLRIDPTRGYKGETGDPGEPGIPSIYNTRELIVNNTSDDEFYLANVLSSFYYLEMQNVITDMMRDMTEVNDIVTRFLVILSKVKNNFHTSDTISSYENYISKYNDVCKRITEGYLYCYYENDFVYTTDEALLEDMGERLKVLYDIGTNYIFNHSQIKEKN